MNIFFWRRRALIKEWKAIKDKHPAELGLHDDRCLTHKGRDCNCALAVMRR